MFGSLAHLSELHPPSADIVQTYYITVIVIIIAIVITLDSLLPSHGCPVGRRINHHVGILHCLKQPPSKSSILPACQTRLVNPLSVMVQSWS